MIKESTLLEKSCRSCGSLNLFCYTKGLSLLTPRPYPLIGEMSVVRCCDCGFVGNFSPSVEKDYSNYYINYNKHHVRNGELGQIDRQYFAEVIDIIEEKGPINWSSTGVLDFGSGTLLFSKMVQEKGARHVFSYDIGGEYPQTEFGLVTSLHCFEHIYNFNKALREIYSVLKEGGVACVAVPDLCGYAEFYCGPYSYFDLEHINHFDIATLSAAMKRAGFQVIFACERKRYVSRTLVVPEVLVVGMQDRRIACS